MSEPLATECAGSGFQPNGRYQKFEVFNQLIGDANLLRAGDFGDGISAAHWRRKAHVTTRYTDPDHHTISLYINGGTGIQRQLGPDPVTGGGPGRCCLMPAFMTSDWLVQGEVELFHLYIPHAAWERAVVEAFDIEPNAVEVPEKTFFLDPLIEQTVRQAMLPLDWNVPADRMAMSNAGQLLMGHMLRSYSTRRDLGFAVRGGLSPVVKRRVFDFVEAHLDQPLTIEDLADVADLSAYHFARMFRKTVGEAPHKFVLRQRIERAMEMLRDDRASVAEIALATGFSSQAHLTTRFSHFTGLTPAKYRNIAR
ncbi:MULTISPECIES: helix-turn-helix domain-containing protein [unclassified Thalassospira]|uniref:helix-turn-helix domain-containing protein n=1 Tax=Thalassospira TaxID=168934 RepID=UPI0009EDF68D|nr:MULTISPECIES: AraC family transcriptional regulator [unclassified Thalassospira]MBO6772902.1 helix-turn-helix transcriptional regulator [Thalassospira sp.]MEE3043955.1 AraC family transcriptional regulator [Pseudomonadota bacterium]RCK20049.1 AraC family transcriptional regulator [Thalassospira profundimaris]URK19076.1 AraC family transcriptional regulator [Thalassospira sp. GO-4]